VGDPPAGDVIKLRGRDDHRLRVGDWRIILRLDEQARIVRVLRVLPRGRAYER
jgi:mRNA-degrading endonuclease RelE of RelBE toxin-antitoxin system